MVREREREREREGKREGERERDEAEFGCSTLRGLVRLIIK